MSDTPSPSSPSHPTDRDRTESSTCFQPCGPTHSPTTSSNLSVLHVRPDSPTGADCLGSQSDSDVTHQQASHSETPVSHVTCLDSSLHDDVLRELLALASEGGGVASLNDELEKILDPNVRAIVLVTYILLFISSLTPSPPPSYHYFT